MSTKILRSARPALLGLVVSLLLAGSAAAQQLVGEAASPPEVDTMSNVGLLLLALALASAGLFVMKRMNSTAHQ